jgi:polyketide biosynthesis enoyl-CoA hydratase PksI
MTEIVTISSHPEHDSIGILRMQDEVSKNTFRDEFVDALMEKLKDLQSNKQFKVILLEGLPDVFCAGASKDALMSIFTGDVEVKDLLLSELFLNVPVPMIAVMEGAALGGGFVVGLCSDIMLMNEKKMYGANFTNMGFTPGMGCTGLLQSLVGEYFANEMMFRGRLFKGREYRGRSLVNYVLPRDEMANKALDIALDIVDKPRKTLEILKYSLSLKKRQALLEARVHEDFMHKISFAQPEVKEIIDKMYNG